MYKTAIVVAAAFLPVLALAQPGGRGGGAPQPVRELEPTAEIMTAHDRNRDGKITSAEAREAGTWLAATFFTFDINRNGELVAEEIDTMRPLMAAPPGGRGGGGAFGGGRGGGRGGPGAGGPGGPGGPAGGGGGFGGRGGPAPGGPAPGGAPPGRGQ